MIVKHRLFLKINFIFVCLENQNNLDNNYCGNPEYVQLINTHGVLIHVMIQSTNKDLNCQPFIIYV